MLRDIAHTVQYHTHLVACRGGGLFCHSYWQLGMCRGEVYLNVLYKFYDVVWLADVFVH